MLTSMLLASFMNWGAPYHNTFPLAHGGLFYCLEACFTASRLG